MDTEETLIKSGLTLKALLEKTYQLSSSLRLFSLTPPLKPASACLKTTARTWRTKTHRQNSKGSSSTFFPSFLPSFLHSLLFTGACFSLGRSLCSAACLQIHAAFYKGNLLGLIPPC